METKIFLSYAWANTSIADEIDNQFKRRGINLIRDIRDLNYRDSIKEFMHKVGKHDNVVMVISDEYLHSENCMYEVGELLNTHSFKERILPVLLDNGRFIFDPHKRGELYTFWKLKLKESETLSKKHRTVDYTQLVKKHININNHIDDFLTNVIDLNMLNYTELKASGFISMFKVLGIEKLDIFAHHKYFYTIKAPMDGLFISQTEDIHREPFVKKFSKIYEGDTVCLMFAMKVYNMIQSEVTGTVAEILVEHHTEVVAGTELFLISDSFEIKPHKYRNMRSNLTTRDGEF